LDICYFSGAILTGAGTLAREAACLGVPSVSFYAGKELLAVDRKMISEKMLYHSRNIDDIIMYLKRTKRKEVNFERSKNVKNQVINKLDEVINKLLS
jgi:predicted glycosyltransferase